MFNKIYIRKLHDYYHKCSNQIGDKGAVTLSV